MKIAMSAAIIALSIALAVVLIGDRQASAARNDADKVGELPGGMIKDKVPIRAIRVQGHQIWYVDDGMAEKRTTAMMHSPECDHPKCAE